jgi:hypothetical protein
MFEPTFRSNPQSSLWLAVLLRAVEDALRPIKTGNNGLSREKQMQDARDYLTTPSRDLLMVCNYAGLDMEAFIDRMKVQIANAVDDPSKRGYRPRRERQRLALRGSAAPL